MKKKALFSLYDLSKVDQFARALVDMGWEIIASQETCRALSPKGIPVLDIADFVGVKESYGFPPTLHPKIEACLTSSRKERIDLVYVIPYPLSVGNDIGGRTLLGLAAKGKRVPVASVADMQNVVRVLRDEGRLNHRLRTFLIDKANFLIASHFDDLICDRGLYDSVFGTYEYGLANGENPYQVPAELFSLKRRDALSIPNFKRVSGVAPCFTNLADADSILHTLCLAAASFNINCLKVPYICIVAKHGNACGMAVSWHDPLEAIDKALFANPRSVWGGEAVVNFVIDENAAKRLYASKRRKALLGEEAWMLDIILTPRFGAGAVKILGRRKNRKLLENEALLRPPMTAQHVYRYVRGGLLRQPPHDYILDLKKLKASGLSRGLIDSLIIAWSVAWSSNHGGNEIALSGDSCLLGAGGGPSTFEAATVAVSRANDCGGDLSGSVFAANAFFPFIDAPQVLVEARVRAGLVPCGGRQGAAIKRYFQSNKIRMIYLPERFRGFSRH